MKTSFYQQLNNEARRPNRRKPRSPGVILGNRAAGLHRWDDEVRADGGKKKEHRRTRHRENAARRRQLTASAVVTERLA